MGCLASVRGRKILGRNLRHYRLLAGLSQQRLADLMSTDPSRISGYERGTTGCTVDIADRIAQVLKIPLAALFDESIPSPPPNTRARRKSESSRLPRAAAKRAKKTKK
jgi:transcriptional regulator with XRE-family HTH domain